MAGMGGLCWLGGAAGFAWGGAALAGGSLLGLPTELGLSGPALGSRARLPPRPVLDHLVPPCPPPLDCMECRSFSCTSCALGSLVCLKAMMSEAGRLWLEIQGDIISDTV